MNLPPSTRRTFLLRALGAAAVAGISAAWPRTGLASPHAAQLGRPRVIVSTDIGGTDPDDFQSMVHLLLCADRLEIEGLISSPYGEGRARHILEVIDRYALDHPNLRTHSALYPEPGALRALTRQGAVAVAGYDGVAEPSEGAEWIVRCARRDDPRPLHLLVWGGIEDLARALHDAPDILPKLRVYFIGGPNKKWSVDAYHYLATQHPTLWIIEANSTYRGWFEGGDQSGDLGNNAFVARHVAGRGALGDYFATLLGGTIKMGDSPSVGWLLGGGGTADPAQAGWGGRFVRAWERPHAIFRGLTDAGARIEQFGVFELALPVRSELGGGADAWMVIENQRLRGHVDGTGSVRFRFSPKDAKEYDYEIRSSEGSLDGLTGALTAFRPDPSQAGRPSPRLPHWWTDDPAPELAEGPHPGARTVSRWREAFLRDFAMRLRRCAEPA